MVGGHRAVRANPYQLFDKEAYFKKIFWIVVGVIAFAVALFVLIILKIWYDYRIYINNENDKERIKLEEIAERKNIIAMENALKSGETDQYTWSQNDEEIELKLPIQLENAASLKSKHIECIFKATSMSIHVLGKEYFKGTFYGEIVPSECSWQFELISTNSSSGSSCINSHTSMIHGEDKSIIAPIIETKASTIGSQTEVEATGNNIRMLEITIKKKENSTNKSDHDDDNIYSNKNNAAIKNRNQQSRSRDELWKYITKEHNSNNNSSLDTTVTTTQPSLIDTSSPSSSLQHTKPTVLKKTE